MCHDAATKAPLLAVSSAPSLYPITLKALSERPLSSMGQTYFIPIDLLSGEWERASEALERFFTHVVVRYVERCLQPRLFRLDQGEYLACHCVGGCIHDGRWNRYRNVVRRFQLNLCMHEHVRSRDDQRSAYVSLFIVVNVDVDFALNRPRRCKVDVVLRTPPARPILTSESTTHKASRTHQ